MQEVRSFHQAALSSCSLWFDLVPIGHEKQRMTLRDHMEDRPEHIGTSTCTLICTLTICHMIIYTHTYGGSPSGLTRRHSHVVVLRMLHTAASLCWPSESHPPKTKMCGEVSWLWHEKASKPFMCAFTLDCDIYKCMNIYLHLHTYIYIHVHERINGTHRCCSHMQSSKLPETAQGMQASVRSWTKNSKN